MHFQRQRLLKCLLLHVVLVINTFVPCMGLKAQEFIARSTSEDQAARSGEQPLKLHPLVEPLFDLSPEDYAWVRQQIRPCEASKLSPSYCLHVLRVHGLDAHFDSVQFSSSDLVLAPLLDTKAAKEVFGKAALVPLRSGARYRSRLPVNTPRWREFHRDQNLSAFAELGLDRSTSLKIDEKLVSIADVLRDSLSNFHLKQDEIEWTALAYALYLPPQKEWSNRYEEHYSFDDLAEELLERPMVGSSCGGTHLLFSLTMIARADELKSILSADTRGRVHERLNLCVRQAVVSQQSDGSWPGDWFFNSALSGSYRGPSPVSTPEHVLVVTGHLAEWMLYLPLDLQPPETTLRQSCRWLLRHLRNQSDEDIEDNICPCTHGICVLRRLGRMSPHKEEYADGEH